MKLEDQVCTLEQAKRLEELLGEDIKSSFYWVDWYGWHIAQPCSKGFVYIDQDGKVYTETIKECFNAFTVAELGVMLQDSIKKDWLGTMGHPVIGYHCSYIYEDKEFGETKSLCSFPHEQDPEFTKTEAQARAEMLIYLLEKELITAQEVKTRLQLVK